MYIGLNWPKMDPEGGYFEYGDEPLDYIERLKFLNQLSDC
jgi:hypothetical protein